MLFLGIMLQFYKCCRCYKLLNQLSSTHSIITNLEYRCWKNVIHQIGSKSEWLLLSASVTTEFGLAFVLTLENAFSYWFCLKANRKSTGSFKKVLAIFKIAFRLRDWHVFM